MLPIITNTEKLDTEIAVLSEERDIVAQLIRQCVEDNAHAARNQTGYRKKYDSLIMRFETAQKHLDYIAAEKQNRNARKERICLFLDSLRKAGNLVTEFDEDLWCATVDTVTVREQKELIFMFKDGSEIVV